MKISYFKTQWFRLLLAVICTGVAIFFALQPAPDTSTLEGANEVTGYMFASICWILSAFIWFGMSIVDWYGERLKLLEAKEERNDAMYELVQELVNANKIDRGYAKKLEARIEKLEGRR
jgi:uncharacterized membrane protein YgaE (UPF0421/DUF939 family)